MNVRVLGIFATIAIAAVLLHGCTESDTVDVVTPEEAGVPVGEEDAPAAAIDVDTLAMTIDPVCKMDLEANPPVTTMEHEGDTYGFCSMECKNRFAEDPETFLSAPEEATGLPEEG